MRLGPQALDQQRVQARVAPSPRDGALVVKDAGSPKQGRGAVRGAPTGLGSLGKVANGQMVVPAHYVAAEPTRRAPGHGPRTAQRSLPEGWAAEGVRRSKGHVPARGSSAPTRPRACAGGSGPYVGRPLCLCGHRCGLGDPRPASGGARPANSLTSWAAAAALGYVCPPAVPAALVPPPRPRGRGQPKKPPRRPGPRPRRCWRRCQRPTGRPSPGGSRRARSSATTLSPCGCTGPRGARRALPRLIASARAELPARRAPGAGDQGGVKGYDSNLPADTRLPRLVELAHSRWPIEPCYEDAKGTCGLDDYHGPRWDGLHRHLALVMLAYSFRRASVGATRRLGRLFPPLASARPFRRSIARCFCRSSRSSGSGSWQPTILLTSAPGGI